MSDLAVEMRDRFEGALAGAAYGDALGWPNESRGGNRSRRTVTRNPTLTAWTRKAGGQYQAYEQAIPAGTYSDDTQLTVAVLRARLKAQDWWLFLAGVELPFWTSYQQGAGGASLRAARLLLKGTRPWEAAEDDRVKYFGAGGNGVAMRVSGHCLAHYDDPRFDAVWKDVLTDGVLTHGHPRALVGALAFAYALWCALRLKATLEYGALLNSVLDGVDEWAKFPDLEDRWPTWAASADVPNYANLWAATVEEQLRLLETARRGLETGALAFDDEVLREIGCFDREVSGAGTIAACAAIYLASRHAAQPEEAVLAAATTRGIDSDTIASMTGAITGAVNGIEWLRESGSALQDRPLFRLLANIAFSTPSEAAGDSEQPSVSARSIRDTFARLTEGEQSITLPNGQRAKVIGLGDVRSKSKRFEYDTWQLEDEWSQTLWLRRQRRVDTDQAMGMEGPLQTSSRIAGFSFFTSDLNAVQSFYGGVLGLAVSRTAQGALQVGDYLAFREKRGAGDVGVGSIIYVDVPDITRCWQIAMASSATTVSPVEDRGGRLRFVCDDPDGRRTEVFQNKPGHVRA